MNKPTSDWLVLIRSVVAGFDSTRDNEMGQIVSKAIDKGMFAAAQMLEE